MQVQVTKWGNSLGLRLPRALAQQTGIAEGQKVNIIADGRRLVVEAVQQVLTIDDMMVNVTPESMREAFDWGEDVGREIVDD